MTAIIVLAAFDRCPAQGWSYVGAPYINQTVGTSTYLYFGDMETNAAGDIYVGYYLYTTELRVAKYSGGSWAQLPSPGFFPSSNIDIEVRGNNCYMAHSGVRGANSYVFVRKYDGTSWQLLGDSILLGNSGSGGWFEFLLDNNEVPTILGGVSAPFGDKQMLQFSGGSWTVVTTLSATAPTIFRENSAIFDANNKLLVVTQGLKGGSTAYNLVNKIDGGTRTTVGDTIIGSAANSKLRLDGSTPFLIFNSPIISKIFAYKLNGASWTFIADTTGTQGTMLNADVTGGKVIYSSQVNPLSKGMFSYENGVRKNIDSVNISGFSLAAFFDLIIPPGSNDMYVMVLEMKPTIEQDISVIKHATSSGPSGIANGVFGTRVLIYPNPSRGKIVIEQNATMAGSELSVYNVLGALVYKTSLDKEHQFINLSDQPKGYYFIKINDRTASSTHKILLQ
jgi:hypothetical protein